MKKIFFINQQGRKNNHGFTLVETLVAITILMIAIAGPLVIATKGLTSAGYARNQMIASFLAQESMEVIKNIRDNNIYNYDNPGDINNNWLTSLSGCINDNFCDASAINSSPISTGCIGLGCRIYYSDTSGYTNTSSSATQTQFYRYFYLEDLSKPDLQEEKRVHVYVNWFEGSIPFSIHLESALIATKR